MGLLSFEDKLKEYADVIVQIGLNVQPGQRLMINALINAAPLVRVVTASAYRAGSPYVDVIWRDEGVNLARFENAPRNSFDQFSVYFHKAALEHVQNGGAFLSITSEDPDLLKAQDPELVALSIKTQRQHMKPVNELLHVGGFNWCIVAYPSTSWAAKVYPGETHEQQVEKLWDALFNVTRVGKGEAVAAWKAHVANLQQRMTYLNGRKYDAIHLYGPDTDLVLGLPQGHLWKGGDLETQSGIRHIPNLPTEEVFTLPHRERVDGFVSASKPLSYAGTLIDGIHLKFEKGRVVEAHANTGEDALKRLIETDEGAAHLGELALVPYSSPVSLSKILFFNTLLDENAASHLALGNAYNMTIEGGEQLDEDAFRARGGNTSLTHVDFMVGSQQMDVDGITADGVSDPIMRKGEWAF